VEQGKHVGHLDVAAKAEHGRDAVGGTCQDRTPLGRFELPHTALEQLAHHSERELGLELTAPRRARPHPGLRRHLARAADQLGLADPRGPIQEQQPTPPAQRIRDGPLNGRELVGSVEQLGVGEGHDESSRGWSEKTAVATTMPRMDQGAHDRERSLGHEPLAPAPKGDIMSEPFIFVTTHAINDGQLDHIKELATRFNDLVEASDTGLVAFHFYLSDDGTEVSNVQVHADAASMDAYLPLVQAQITQALELSQTTRIDVFGSPGPILQEVLRQNEAMGVPVRVVPNHLDGFTRSAIRVGDGVAS
jgi:hypothetical protein